MEEIRQVIADQEEDHLSGWELRQMASALQEAKEMERDRAAYFASLYSDIRYPSIVLEDITERTARVVDVEYQALDVIDKKKAYDLRIAKLKEKYGRWRAFLKQLDPQVAELLRNYFERGIAVQHDILEPAVKMAAKIWTKNDRSRGYALDAEAKEDYKEFRKQFPDLFKAKPRNRFPQLIDGEIKMMTRFEYDRFLYKETEARLDQQFRELYKNHPKRIGR